jgi:hypothetical protein
MRLALLAVLVLAAACAPKPESTSDSAPLTVEEPALRDEPQPAGPEPQVDPTALDLSKIALAVRLPSTFRADEDGARLQINIISPRLGVNIAETIPLVPTPDAEGWLQHLDLWHVAG